MAEGGLSSVVCVAAGLLGVRVGVLKAERAGVGLGFNMVGRGVRDRMSECGL